MAWMPAYIPDPNLLGMISMDTTFRPGDLALSCNPSYLGGQNSGMA
jgi:hypothetical protein